MPSCRAQPKTKFQHALLSSNTRPRPRKAIVCLLEDMGVDVVFYLIVCQMIRAPPRGSHAPPAERWNMIMLHGVHSAFQIFLITNPAEDECIPLHSKLMAGYQNTQITIGPSKQMRLRPARRGITLFCFILIVQWDGQTGR